MRVLDVACGTGNAAFPAARAGGEVTGLDLVPKLLDEGREKARQEGLEIEWVEGDAEDLPFEDGTFDRVFSTFGHMFAPRHRRTADEMARVCRGGGAIAICCWTPEGTVGDVFGASASFMPPPLDFAEPPIVWGTEDHVRDMFGSVATDFEFERHSATIEWESPEGFAEFFFERFGPMVMARQTSATASTSSPIRFSGSSRPATRRRTAAFTCRRSTCSRSSGCGRPKQPPSAPARTSASTCGSRCPRRRTCGRPRDSWSSRSRA